MKWNKKAQNRVVVKVSEVIFVTYHNVAIDNNNYFSDSLLTFLVTTRGRDFGSCAAFKKPQKKSTSAFLSAPAPLRHHEVLNKNGWEASKMGLTRAADEIFRLF